MQLILHPEVSFHLDIPKVQISCNVNSSHVAAAAAAPSASVRTMAGIPDAQERWSQRADD